MQLRVSSQWKFDSCRRLPTPTHQSGQFLSFWYYSCFVTKISNPITAFIWLLKIRIYRRVTKTLVEYLRYLIVFINFIPLSTVHRILFCWQVLIFFAENICRHPDFILVFIFSRKPVAKMADKNLDVLKIFENKQSVWFTIRKRSLST